MNNGEKTTLNLRMMFQKVFEILAHKIENNNNQIQLNSAVEKMELKYQQKLFKLE